MSSEEQIVEATGTPIRLRAAAERWMPGVDFGPGLLRAAADEIAQLQAELGLAHTFIAAVRWETYKERRAALRTLPSPPASVPSPPEPGWFDTSRDSGVSPCFVNCGQPACQKLGCVRVYNAEHRDVPALDGPQGLVLDHVYYVIDSDEMTGAEIRALPDPSVRDDYDLFLIAEGQMDVKVDYDETIVARAKQFITAPRFINGG